MSVKALILLSLLALTLNATGMERTLEDVGIATDLRDAGSWLKEDKTNKTCSICLEDIEKGDKTNGVVTPCAHAFHKDCIAQWRKVKEHDTCPLCRKKLTPPLIDAVAKPDMAKAENIIVNTPGSVNKPSCYGYTPLIVAAELGNVDMVKMLLKKKANVRHQRNDGLTALMCAVAKNNMKIVELLVAKDSSTIQQKTSGGCTALGYAGILQRTTGDDSMLKFLQKK